MTKEQKGLRLAAAVTMLTGLSITLAAYPPLAAPLRLLADLVIWPLDGAETLGGSDTRLMLAIGGGLMTGWGAMIWQLAGAALARAPDLVRPIIRNSVLIWFAVDSTASVMAGGPLNLIGNLAFLALLLWPLRLARDVRPIDA